MKPRRKKWLLLGSALAAVLLTAGLVIWCSFPSAGPPQFVTLPDGTVYKFAGVDWGTGQIPPIRAQRISSHLPAFLRNWVQKNYGQKLGFVDASQTLAPFLKIWLCRVTNGAPDLVLQGLVYAVLSDENGVEASAPCNVSAGNPWTLARFQIIPRRSRTLLVNFYIGTTFNYPIGRKFGSIRLPNPLFGKFPQWQPEAIPATKKAGDVEVQLTDCRFGSRLDPHFAMTFALQINPRGQPSGWALQRMEVSDATGNCASTEYSGRGGQFEFPFTGIFWPEENALRTKLWLRRVTGFPADELITFTNLPVPVVNATNGVTLTAKYQGRALTLRNFSENRIVFFSSRGSSTWPYQLSLVLEDPTGELAAGIVSVSADTGEEVADMREMQGARELFRYFTNLPPNAHYLNVVVSVQKMRTVEFLVKPQ